MMIHTLFNLLDWETVFPLARLREEARIFVDARRQTIPTEYKSPGSVERHIVALSPGGERVTGPYEMCVIEQLRKEALPSARRSSGVRTDVFVFRRGEPADRSLTKIGGLPYWPSARRWPSTDNGRPLTFIGQICFADSIEIAGPLPGDVLLLFGDEDDVLNNDHDRLVFEWVQLGIVDLVAREEVPCTSWHIEPCFGDIHPTFDYPDEVSTFSAYHNPYLIGIVEGTKIGGIPRWIQSPDAIPGRFLCAVGSIDPQPYAQRPFPFINVEQPVGSDDDIYLVWGDVGSVYIFITADNQIHWTCQYY